MRIPCPSPEPKSSLLTSKGNKNSSGVFPSPENSFEERKGGSWEEGGKEERRKEEGKEGEDLRKEEGGRGGRRDVDGKRKGGKE